MNYIKPFTQIYTGILRKKTVKNQAIHIDYLCTFNSVLMQCNNIVHVPLLLFFFLRLQETIKDIAIAL